MKKDKGSIAIFVLVALLFMSGFLLILYASNANKSKTVKEQFDIIKQIYTCSDVYLEKMHFNSIAVVLDKNNLTIEEGDTERIIATIKNENEDAIVTWKLEDKNIATMEKIDDRTVELKGISIGETKLIAEYEGKKGICEISVIPEKKTELDIANGTIELYSNGYKQNGSSLISTDNNKYVITGTTTENTVKVMDVGTYKITIKDLNIDVSGIDKMCAFNANRGAKAKNLYVNVIIEGSNTLCGGGSAAGLGFSKATPNVDGETEGSTLTINGDGELNVTGGWASAGIGSGYTGLDSAAGEANNIIINGGNITAKAGTNGAAIGGGLYNKVNNIIINGGNINAIGSNRFGIGTAAADLDNITINGGIINITGGEYGGGIGGSESSGKITINGGIINVYSPISYSYSKYPAIGDCNEIEINGGTLIAKSNSYPGIFNTRGNIKILGGSIVSTGRGANIGKLDENGTLIETAPTNGTNNLYLTSIQLSNVTEKQQITSLTTSDNIIYGITDMYCSSDDESTTDINEGGKLYLYLPSGTRTITVSAGGKSYSAIVTTGENNEVTLLTEV